MHPIEFSKLFKEFKIDVEILVGQAVCKLWIKIAKMMLESITQEPLGLPKLRLLMISDRAENMSIWGQEEQYPLNDYRYFVYSGLVKIPTLKFICDTFEYDYLSYTTFHEYF